MAPFKPAQLRKKFFAAAPKRVKALLDEIERHGNLGTGAKPDAASNDAMLRAVDDLIDAGQDRLGSALFAVAHPRGARLGPLLDRVKLSPDERLALLTHFARKGDDEHYPCLDLSRQDLRTIPKEIDRVPVPSVNVGTKKSPVPYSEINLGYNPLGRLTADDFRLLNRFEAVHFIALKKTKLPKHIALLTNAIMINISWSDVRELPPEIYGLTRLRAIKMNWTSIRTLSDDIANLKRLAFIEIAETPLAETLHVLEDDDPDPGPALDEARRIKKLLDAIGCRVDE